MTASRLRQDAHHYYYFGYTEAMQDVLDGHNPTERLKAAEAEFDAVCEREAADYEARHAQDHEEAVCTG